MPRPTKLTPDTHAKIIGLLRQGNYHDTASRVAGVDPDTVRRWVQRGRVALDRADLHELPDDERPFAAFAIDYDSALPTFEAMVVNKLLQSGDPKLLIEIIKRRFPEHWGDRLDVRVQERAVVELLDVIRSRADPATYDRVLSILAEDGSDATADELEPDDRRH